MLSDLAIKIVGALREIKNLRSGDSLSTESISRQLQWCKDFLTGKPLEPKPGPFSMGAIATREFDMYGDKLELARLINEIQDSMEGVIKSGGDSAT